MARNGGSFREQHSRDRVEHAFALVTSGARGVVISAVNQSARRVGVQVGQTLADARAVHPSLMTSPAEPCADARVLREIACWTGRYGPNRNVGGADGLWIEITGVAHLFGGEALLARDLGRRLKSAGFTARIGIADTIAAAHALARFATGPRRPVEIALPGQTESKINNLPVDALRLTEDSILLLKRLGLRRIGQLTQLPRASLARRFRDEAKAGRKPDREALSRAVVWRLDQALGRIPEPCAVFEDQPVHRHVQAFDEPLTTSQGIEAALERLSIRLAAGLSEIDEGALLIRLCLYRSDGTRAANVAGASLPTNEPVHIASLFLDRLERMDAGMGVDLVALEALRVEPLKPGQATLSAGRSGRMGSCTVGVGAGTSQLIDRLTNRLGSGQVVLLRQHPSHLPELSERRIPALSAHARTRDADLAPDPRSLCNRRRTGPRPPFLLSVPEPIRVIAELPEGAPARFLWRRVSCRIARSDGPERIAPEWWRDLMTSGEKPRKQPVSSVECPAETEQCASGDSQILLRRSPRTRDYYVLEDDQGGRYWVFREGFYQSTSEQGPPAWYMHGLFG